MRILSACLFISMTLASSSLFAEHAYGEHGASPAGKNCGSNYMLPGNTARLGSHTFMILGQDGPHHVLAAHRSGTPPHNYQFVLRFRLDDDEMARYAEAWVHSKTLPAFTTIDYDANKKQLSRTFFCLADLEKIFGKAQKKGDKFEKLFPIKGALMMNADHEGVFKILENVVPGPGFSLERSDVEIVHYRYLPSYLPQKELRQSIKKDPAKIVPLFSDAPRTATEKNPRHRSFFAQAMRNTDRCRKNYRAPKTKVFESPHTFMLLPSSKKNTTLALHVYGQAPNNFQSLYELTLSDEESKRLGSLYAQKPYLVSKRFCLDDPKSARAKDFAARLFVGGEPPHHYEKDVGALKPLRIKNIVNRELGSFMDPLDIAREVLPKDSAEVPPADFIALSLVDDTIALDARYAKKHNFAGRPIKGYEGERCFLKREAARALSDVQEALKTQGFGLLVFDCYRPQRAVDDFMAWTQESADTKMKVEFYPKEKKSTLVKRGYIASKSGHSKGNALDLSLVRLDGTTDVVEASDCKTISRQKGEVDMGTPYDCFSDQAATASKRVSERARAQRMVLKKAMEAAGFKNYSKEWWHYTYKTKGASRFYDFVVR